MNPLFSHVKQHFASLRSQQKWAFIWRVWIETTLFAYIVANILQAILRSPGRTDLDGYSPLALVGLTVFVGPLFETLVFQCVALELAGSLRLRRFLQFAVSIVPFAIAHFFAGIPTFVSAGVIAGFYFAFTYDHWKQESFFVGVAMTFILHSSFNLVGVLGMLLLR